MQHIIVCSYPRSGTHLFIDLVRNNFSCFYNSYISFNRFIQETKDNKVFSLLRRIESSNRIIKTHYLPELIDTFHKQGNVFLEHILNNSFWIYIIRDGRDVIVSKYYRDIVDKKIKPSMLFSDYLKSNMHNKTTSSSLPREWGNHVKMWTENEHWKPLIIQYEDMILKPKLVF